MFSSPHRYCPFYCEENIWHLCAEPEFEGHDARVVFISNSDRQVALWGQSQSATGFPVVWDYHVILLTRRSPRADRWRVFDLDTALGFPLPVETYLDGTFPVPDLLPPEHAPSFRVLPAARYRRELRTDRRHMARDDGTYRSPPPPWPAIGEGSNLMRFIAMEDDFLGDVHDLDGLRRWLTPHEDTGKNDRA